MSKETVDLIEESFGQYAGAVAQSRAFVDVRDALKPSNRQINYCLYTDKFLPNKPFKKTLKAIGSIARLYIHGDASAEGIIMRSGQPFALRYPLVEVDGNGGNLMLSGNWAAPRYTSARLSALNVQMFEDIEKETIEEWLPSYDDTEMYPAVLPSKGYYNIINGTNGIGVGVASSIPQFNIKQVNGALIKLLLNPDCTFEDIYCPPDFATGGYLINESEVKEALKYGSKDNAKEHGEKGASCKLRAKIDYDKKDNCLIATEIPYSVYTNTICGQLEAILEDESNPGIIRFNDLTGQTPLIKIYLGKDANPDKIVKYLYKNTSLQYHFAINMTMLDMGRFPKVFTWKEALQAHIDHEKTVYRRGFEFDLRKIENRIHIIDGLLICLASIDEVVKVIKSSSSTAEAKEKLIKNFLLDEAQAKAVLDMKLSRLAHLEVEKLKDERSELCKEAEKINTILNNKDLFNQELINGWERTAQKFGDDRRTKIITVAEDDEEKEIESVVAEDCVVTMTRSGMISRVPAASFKVQNRNGKGVKSINEAILDSISTNTIDTLMIFTDKGKMYRLLVDNIPGEGKYVSVNSLVNMELAENVIAITSLYRKTKAKYILFITKMGLVKKTEIKEYMTTKRATGIAAIKLNDGDSIANVTFINDEDLILITKLGYAIKFETSNINPIGRVSAGVKGIKLSTDDSVIIGLPIHDRKDNLAVFKPGGLGKKISLDEIPLQNRYGKGVLISDDDVVGAAMINDKDHILIVGKPNNICIAGSDIPLLGRTAAGNIMIKNSKITSVVKL